MKTKPLKNYVVKVKNVSFESSQKFIGYLLSSNVKSHEKTKILNFKNTDKNQIMSNLIDIKSKNEKLYYLNGKGGKKLKNIFKSLTLNIPKDYEVNENDMLEIHKLFEYHLETFLKSKGIFIDLQNNVSVGHFQDNKHIHYLLNQLDKNGNNIRLFTEKKFLNTLKVFFSMSVDKVLDTKIDNYKVEVLKDNKVKSKEKFTDMKEKVTYQNLLMDLESMYEEDRENSFLKNTIFSVNKHISNLRRNKNDTELKNKINDKLEKINKHNGTYLGI